MIHLRYIRTTGDGFQPPNITIEEANAHLTLDEMLDLYRSFLLALGYSISTTESIQIVDETESGALDCCTYSHTEPDDQEADSEPVLFDDDQGA